MIKKNKLLFGILFLLVVSLLFVSANPYSRSFPQFSSEGSGTSFYGDATTFSKNLCQEGTDFVLQINPFGCSPAIVRSDSLEQHDVPITCQLSAIQINPLIKVDAIESITFSGQYPKDVSKVAFLPARAALGGKDNNLNNPVLNNIGSVVIVLKQNKNESSMPEFVQGNLTARIKYDIKNAFGITQTTFYLPQTNDNEWEETKNLYGFWDGKGYLRAESISSDSARISIYQQDTRVATTDLKIKEKSSKIYLPGFDCLAGLELKLEALENPGVTARLNINGENVEVARGEKFLDNRCTVRNIADQGARQSVEIQCKQDTSGFIMGNSFYLEIIPKLDISVGDKPFNGAEAGMLLHKVVQEDGTKGYYLGYVGTLYGSGKKEDLYAIIVQGKYSELGDKLNEDILQDIADYNRRVYAGVSGSKDKGTLKEAFEGSLVKLIKDASVVSQNLKNLFGDTGFYVVFSDKKKDIDRINFKLNGLSVASNFDLSNYKDVETNYNFARQEYRNVIESFGGISYPEKKTTFSEESLFHLIEMADNSLQKRDVIDLCAEFKTKYSDSESYNKLFALDGSGICNNVLGLSSDALDSRMVLINGKYNEIKLLGTSSPSAYDSGAEIYVSGTNTQNGNYLVRTGDTIQLGDKDYIVLKSVKDDSVIIEKFVSEDTGTIKLPSVSNSVEIKKGDRILIGDREHSIFISNVYLNKKAKVSVIPAVDNQYSNANFSFRVGIEKRAIQLTPDEIKKKIKDLEEEIKEWEDISEPLGETVEAMNGACLATGAAFNLYNLVNNLGGKSISRKKVMDEYWRPWCEGEIASEKSKYNSVEQCFYENNDEIEKDVEDVLTAMNKQDNVFKELQKIEGVVTKEGLFGIDKSINQVKLKEEYVPRVKSSLNVLNQIYSEKIEVTGVSSVSVGDFIDKYVTKDLSIEDLKDLELNAELASSTGTRKTLGETNLKKTVERIIREQYNYKKVLEEQKKFTTGEIQDLSIDTYVGKDSRIGTYGGHKRKGSEIKCNSPNGCDLGLVGDTEYSVQVVSIPEGQYLVILNKAVGSSLDYSIVSAYKYIESNGRIIIVSNDEKDATIKVRTYFPKFIEASKASYNNRYIASAGLSEVVIRYYDKGQDQRLPAIVPFDKNQGWYALVPSSLSYSKSVQGYSQSGRPESFYLCNVGSNGREEGRGGDDVCQLVVLGVSSTYSGFYGLSGAETETLVSDAVNAIYQASQQANQKQVTINVGKREQWTIKIGSPASESPDYECTDYMSPQQCKILFNICDPVVCPSSRCDLKGAYPNKNVVQSGIIGSIVLCAHNFVGFGGDNYIPVCLTGIKVGIDGWVSILKSYQSCLNTNLETGQMVGICDELYSVYACDFFWKQSLPLLRTGLPYLVSALIGEGPKGGGEYASVQSAFDSTQKSMSGFLNYYQTDSNRLFKATSIEEFIGDEVCKLYVSASMPEGSLLDSLTSVNSPPQFHAKLEISESTSATNPPTYEYRVTYHVFAGDSQGAQYLVYLEGSDSGGYYRDAGVPIQVDRGYIGVGESVTEKKSIRAPSGYNRLCVNVNGQKECGFKQVSTSFAVDYLKDMYLKDEANASSISSTEECISGSSGNLYSLMNLNVQSSAEALVDPQIYNRGLVRVCATNSPGMGTDTREGMDGARWVSVGYCEKDKNIRCWLDLNSLDDAIENMNFKSDVLDSKYAELKDSLEEKKDILSENALEAEIKKIEELKSAGSYEDVISAVNAIEKKIFWDYKKAYVLFLRANAYQGLVKKAMETVKEDLAKKATATSSATATSEEPVEEVKEVTTVILNDIPFYVSNDYVMKSDNQKQGETVDLQQHVTSAVDNLKNADGTRVNPDLVRAIIAQESAWNVNAQSTAEAIGLMQLMEKSAVADMAPRKNCNKYCSSYYNEQEWKIDSQTNVNMGVCYMKCLYEHYGMKDIELLLASYNGGMKRVKDNCFVSGRTIRFSECKSGLSNETQKYVPAVITHYEFYTDTKVNLNNVEMTTTAITSPLETPTSSEGCKDKSEVKNPYKLDCNDPDAFKGGGMTKDICEKINENEDIINLENLGSLKDCYGRGVMHYAAAFSSQKYTSDLAIKLGRGELIRQDEFGNIPAHYAGYYNRNDILTYYSSSSGISKINWDSETSKDGISPSDLNKYTERKSCSDCGGFFGRITCSKKECIVIGLKNDLECIANVQGSIVTCTLKGEGIPIKRENTNSIVDQTYKKYSDKNLLIRFIIGTDQIKDISTYENRVQNLDEKLVFVVGPEYILENAKIGSDFKSGGIFISGTNQQRITISGGGSSIGNFLNGGNIFISDSEIQADIGRMMQNGLIYIDSNVLIKESAVAGGIGYGMRGGIIHIKSGAEIKSYIGNSMTGGQIIIEDGVRFDLNKVDKTSLNTGRIKILGGSTSQSALDSFKNQKPVLKADSSGFYLSFEVNPCPGGISFDLKQRRSWFFDKTLRSGKISPAETSVFISATLEKDVTYYVTNIQCLDKNSKSIAQGKDSNEITFAGIVPSGPLIGKTIILDAGHGGREPGAMFPFNCQGSNCYYEKNFNLNVVLDLKAILERQGAKIVLTRQGDEFVSIPNRVKIAEDNKADLLVSIHFNSVDSDEACPSGAEVLYFDDKNKDLAKKISSLLSKDLKITDRGAKMRNDLGILKTGNIPSVLVEVDFMCNSDAVRYYSSRTNQGEVAISISNAIKEFYA